MTPEGRRACVIGAGFGGLSLAIRLQAAGVATTLVEARDQPGGCVHHWRSGGFTFEVGPAAIGDPANFAELWALTGHAIADDVELLPVAPICRFNWPDGAVFDQSSDPRGLRAEIARLSGEDLGGYEQFLVHCAALGELEPDGQAFLGLRGMAEAAPAIVRHQAWRPVHATISRFVSGDKLRQVLGFPTLLAGGNPLTAATANARAHAREQAGGAWWPRGGVNRLAAAMVRQFERLGGTVRLGDPVTEIHCLGTRASEVETRGGWRERFDAVASNADVVHTYRDLLRRSPRGPRRAKTLAGKRFGAGLFVVHFGVEGTWPGIPHHTVLFGPRYEGLLEDIFTHGVLPRDGVISLGHPSVTDPSLAPEGKSVFCAAVPVANLGKLAVDWRELGPVLERRVLEEIARRLIPDLADRLVTASHYTPRDLAGDFNAHLGSPFSLEPIAGQSAWFRPHNRDAVIGNFYLVGGGTQPGPGIAGAVAGAKTTAGLMLEDLAG